MSKSKPNRSELYQEAVAVYGGAIERLARAYEADRDRQQDLLQEIHMAIWRSLEIYESRCAIRTWVYRVAHSYIGMPATARTPNPVAWTTPIAIGPTSVRSPANASKEPLTKLNLRFLIKFSIRFFRSEPCTPVTAAIASFPKASPLDRSPESPRELLYPAL
jgi:hypothetical protein